MTKKYSVRLTEGSLRRVGIDLLGFPDIHLACRACGQHFMPLLRPGARLPRGWWRCPNGCNEGADVPEEREAKETDCAASS